MNSCETYVSLSERTSIEHRDNSFGPITYLHSVDTSIFDVTDDGMKETDNLNVTRLSCTLVDQTVNGLANQSCCFHHRFERLEVALVGLESDDCHLLA